MFQKCKAMICAEMSDELEDGTNSPHAEFIDIDYNRENPIILRSGKDLIHKCPNALTEIHCCQGICCDACHEERVPKTKGRSSRRRGDRDMLAMSVTDKSVSSRAGRDKCERDLRLWDAETDFQYFSEKYFGRKLNVPTHCIFCERPFQTRKH
jgi:hypothetical protein